MIIIMPVILIMVIIMIIMLIIVIIMIIMIMLVVIMIIVMVAMIVEHNQYNIDVLDNYGTVGYQPSLLHYLEFVWMFLYQF